MQLVKHIMLVKYIRPNENEPKYIQEVNCADPVASRQLGREIAQWMALGVGYRVESVTVELERR